MRHELISDLHKLLFSVPFESTKQWDLNEKLGRAFLNFHNVHFKEKDEIPDNEYWSTDDVEEHFYLRLCPGISLSVTELEYICDDYLDLDMWEQTSKMWDALDKTQSAINKITASYAPVAISINGYQDERMEHIRHSHNDQCDALRSISEPLEDAA